MSRLLSRLFPNSNLDQINQYKRGGIPPSYILSLQPSSKDPNLTTVRFAGSPADTPPLCSLFTSSTTKPNVLIFRGYPDSYSTIGDATFHSLSSTADLSLHGKPIRMKMSELTGNFSIECAPMGKLKWKVNPITGSSMELRDSSGSKLARLKSTGIPGLGSGKELEILVPCDEFFIDLMVLSGVAAKAMKKSMDEAASEILQAIAGA